jgi:hypothetical protein
MSILPYLPYIILTLLWVSPISNVMPASSDDFRSLVNSAPILPVIISSNADMESDCWWPISSVRTPESIQGPDETFEYVISSNGNHHVGLRGRALP